MAALWAALLAALWRPTRATLLAGLACLAPLAARADFINGGFETGDFSGWTLGGRTAGGMVATDGAEIVGEGGIFSPAVVNVRTGQYAAVGVVAATQGAGEYFSLSQTVDFVDDVYEIGFYLGTDAAENFDVLEAIDDGLLGVYVDGALLQFEVAEHTGQGFVPPGADPEDFRRFAARYDAAAGPLEVELRISGSGSSRAGISIDDAYATPVSETGAVSGDYNSDGQVDAADYTVWRDTLGQPASAPFSGGDGDGDALVDQDDYAVWRGNYGQSATGPAAAQSPEPSAALLVAVLAALGTLGRRHG